MCIMAYIIKLQKFQNTRRKINNRHAFKTSKKKILLQLNNIIWAPTLLYGYKQ